MIRFIAFLCKSVGMFMGSDLKSKPCSRCKELKSLDMFSPAKKGPLGRKSDCKKCVAKDQAERSLKKKIENERIESAKLTYPRIPDHMKQCKYCLEIKVKEGNFQKHSGCKDGFTVKCNACFNSNRPSRSGCEKSKEIWKKYYSEKRDGLLRKQKESESRKKREAERYKRDRKRILKVRNAYIRSPSGKAVRNRNARARFNRMKNAQPNWLSPKQIKEMDDIYWLAQDLKIVTGEVYHVDHIVPLRGTNICGLHVPWNLQILPADLNIRKSNKMET